MKATIIEEYRGFGLLRVDIGEAKGPLRTHEEYRFYLVDPEGLAYSIYARPGDATRSGEARVTVEGQGYEATCSADLLVEVANAHDPLPGVRYARGQLQVIRRRMNPLCKEANGLARAIEELEKLEKELS